MLSSSAFRANTGPSPFQQLEHVQSQQCTDVYYDSNNVLLNEKFQVRRRNADWEAWARIDAPLRSLNHPMTFDLRTIASYDKDERDWYSNSTDEIIIRMAVGLYTGLDRGGGENFGLGKIAEFKTKREIYLADQKYHIMLDETDFGHESGTFEVERRYDEGIWPYYPSFTCLKDAIRLVLSRS